MKESSSGAAHFGGGRIGMASAATWDYLSGNGLGGGGAKATIFINPKISDPMILGTDKESGVEGSTTGFESPIRDHSR